MEIVESTYRDEVGPNDFGLSRPLTLKRIANRHRESTRPAEPNPQDILFEVTSYYYFYINIQFLMQKNKTKQQQQKTTKNITLHTRQCYSFSSFFLFRSTFSGWGICETGSCCGQPTTHYLRHRDSATTTARFKEMVRGWYFQDHSPAFCATVVHPFLHPQRRRDEAASTCFRFDDQTSKGRLRAGNNTIYTEYFKKQNKTKKYKNIFY